MEFYIPEKVNYIITTLMDNGFEAYAVGGCVRDMALGKEPNDWDVTTSATPREIKKLFKRTIDTGIEHGTVTVLLDKTGFEVTTYRLDGEYKNHRHPENVVFTSSLIEDLKRRDFTINAMAFNEQEGFVDEFNGMDDLRDKIIRCVGDPRERFEEDALRILRALRFSAQLNFKIHHATKLAMEEKVGLLRNISKERIRDELTKLLISDRPDKIKFAYKLGITSIVLPEFDKMMETQQNNRHHKYSVGEHTLRTLCEVAKDDQGKKFSIEEKVILRWTMLLHDIMKPESLTTDSEGEDHFYGHQEMGAVEGKKILKELKFDNYNLNIITHLIRWHAYRFTLTPKAMRRAIATIGKKYMPLIFEVQRADSKGKNPELIESMIENIDGAEKIYLDIIKKDQCVCLKDMKINGSDLIELGYKQGKDIGKSLGEILDLVLEDPSLNTRDQLIDLAKTIKQPVKVKRIAERE